MTNFKQSNRSKQASPLRKVSKTVKGMSRAVKAEIKSLINKSLIKAEKTLNYLEKELHKLQKNQPKKQAALKARVKSKLRTAMGKKQPSHRKKKVS
jgi:hypothetical protein